MRCVSVSARARLFVLATALWLGAGAARGAADLFITNTNLPLVGFNDPTPALPVGGNAGTTLGEQRLVAFRHAASLWGATLTSSVPVNIQAEFVPLTCTSSSAVLGSAGAIEIVRDFAGATLPGTWYPSALANKLTGTDLHPGVPQILARFNASLGQPGCLDGVSFYLGLDGNHGADIDLVAVLLHEFAHGLGFQSFTDADTGAFAYGMPSIWDHHLTDTTDGRTWATMADSERAASARNARRLAWNGPNVTAAVPSVLFAGTPRLNLSGPAAGPLVGDKEVGLASFGPALSTVPVVGQVMPVVDQADAATGLACSPLSALNRLAVRGGIALVDRGDCDFVTKVKNAQLAGAIGVLVADNAAGSPPEGLGGIDPEITIPAVRITQADGAALKVRLRTRSRTSSGIVASLGINSSQYLGADLFGRALLYSPDPWRPGSSVSHFDTLAFPNLLMEPSISADLAHMVSPPRDLTLQLLRDIGW